MTALFFQNLTSFWGLPVAALTWLMLCHGKLGRGLPVLYNECSGVIVCSRIVLHSVNGRCLVSHRVL